MSCQLQIEKNCDLLLNLTIWFFFLIDCVSISYTLKLIRYLIKQIYMCRCNIIFFLLVDYKSVAINDIPSLPIEFPTYNLVLVENQILVFTVKDVPLYQRGKSKFLLFKIGPFGPIWKFTVKYLSELAALKFVL